ncbi:spermidine/putrescine ABC transporter substrate-binding protein [soil metagenome]
MAFHPRERPIWRPPMSRREALRLMAGAAAAGGLLAGCGAGSSTSSAARVIVGTREDPVKQPLYEDNHMIDSGLEPEKGPLRVYNWADYVYQRVLKDFEKEFGVEVELTTFYNLEEATRKLRTGKVNFDVFVPTAEIIPKFVAGKLLQPLNHDYLSNLKKNVWPMLADPYYDGGSRYTVPYTVYLTGIGWRTDMVSADIAAMNNPWEAFWDREYKGIAGLYDDYRETVGVGMYKNGITDINGDKPGDLAAARDSLVELTNLVDIRYTIDGAYAKLPEGVFGIHHAWSGDMVNAPYYMPKGGDPSVLRYVWPPRARGGAGGYVSNDSLAVLKGAEHPVLAHMFLNYMLDDKVSIKNFSWNAYQPPINTLKPDSLVSDGMIRENLASTVIEQDDFDMGQTPQQLTPEQDKRWLEAWSRVQQGG